jgi:nicotinamidase-related amidase
MNPKKTALVLVEYQNDFTSEGGALHGAVKDVMESTATIIYAPIQFAPGYNEITSHLYGILKGVADTSSFIKGSWGAQMIDELAPQSGDIVLEGKRGLDAFASMPTPSNTTTPCSPPL